MPTSKNLELSELARKVTVSDTNLSLTGVTIPSASLENTAVTAGSYGSASQVPVLTVNAKGQITAASTTSVAGVSAFSYTTGTKTLNISTADGGSFNAALTNLATETYVNTAVSNLVDTAPSTLNTLNELAAALGNDPNYATTITSALGTKATISALTALETSLQNLIQTRLPSGVILMWSGSIATIPTGWVLCDGTNGTPNLRDRFIVGAGSTYSVAATGGSKDATLVSHSHTYSGTTSTAGDHNHPIYNYRTNDFNGAWNYKGMVYSDDHQGTFYSYTDNAGNHNHTFSGSTSTDGSSATNANLPPYYALAYIMKV